MELLTFTRNQPIRIKQEPGKLADSFSVMPFCWLNKINQTGFFLSFDFMKLAVTECCERLAYYGMSTNLVNYIEKHLSMGNVAASNSVTNWSGTCYATPLIGAFLADAYLGRYWTIASFVVIYICVSFHLLLLQQIIFIFVFLNVKD